MSLEQAAPHPVKLSPRDRAEATDRAAREIIDLEVNARERKTQKLKAMRLAKSKTQGSGKAGR